MLPFTLFPFSFLPTMAWDVRQTYYYLVCFATLLMVIIGTVQVAGRLLDLSIPDEPYAPVVERPGTTPEDATDEGFEARRARENAHHFRQQQRRHVRDLLGSLALVLVAAPVYVYHWRRVRRLHETAPDDG